MYLVTMNTIKKYQRNLATGWLIQSPELPERRKTRVAMKNAAHCWLHEWDTVVALA